MQTPNHCQTCYALAETLDATPHVHCAPCGGAILPNMTQCAWCGAPAPTFDAETLRELLIRTGAELESERRELAELASARGELLASLLASRADCEMWRRNYFTTLEQLAAERAERDAELAELAELEQGA